MTALYQPGHGRFTVSDEEALAALRTLAAAAPCTLVSHGPDGFRVTLLPMLVHPEPGGGLVLRGHVARGNVDRKSTRLNSSHSQQSRMPSSA